ncbi:MAG: hypothetical protein LUD29_05890 [Clostridia bacterium]|nr:hypothetical protein [Clostridia bacterium]
MSMSLSKTEKSIGAVSHGPFLTTRKFEKCASDMSDDDVIYAICRGGWSQRRYSTAANTFSVARNIFDATRKTDIK